jgi:O-antigen ligase
VRWFGVMVLVFAALACLFWSGSKSGWLLMLIVGVLAVVHGKATFRTKILVMTVVLVGGGLVFGLRHAGYFKKGATSVEARFDYWRAAVQTAKEHPVLGTGPGTFMVPYGKIKKPESEMARLVHNDYLEQASDTGVVSFVTFSALIWGSLVFLYRKRATAMQFAVWLGLLGLALQSLSEFHFYIPGLAWPWFLFLGWLWGAVRKGKPAEVQVGER